MALIVMRSTYHVLLDWGLPIRLSHGTRLD